MKKKVLLVFIAFLASLSINAQVIFNEDFDNIPGPTAGGAGTYVFPAGWYLFNVDGSTPAAAVSYVNEAWERREDFANNVSDSAAFSTSWYSPVGAADDWMFSPAITITNNCILSWNAVAYDPSFPDGYEVRVLTETPTLGNITTSTVIFSTPAENSTWTNREFDLSSYAGSTIHIGFRNNSNNMFLLLIDDIIVSHTVAYDLELTSIDQKSEYSVIPTNFEIGIPLMATITNLGNNTFTNVKLGVDILNSYEDVIFTSESEPITELGSGVSHQFLLPDYVPTVSDNFVVKFYPIAEETDEDNSNDTLSTEIAYSDSIYARDNGVNSATIGIGAGNGGFVGQKFSLPNDSYITSVMYHIGNGVEGEPVCVGLFHMNGITIEGYTPFLTTDTLYLTGTDSLFNLHFADNNVLLPAGDYLFAGIEFTNTLGLANSDNIFTPNTVFVWWPTIPSGDWSPVESFGGAFSKALQIRPVFNACKDFSLSFVITNASCETCADGSVQANVTGANGTVSFDWGAYGTNQEITGLLPGSYEVTVSDQAGCHITDVAEISFGGSRTDIDSQFKLYPNPNSGLLYIQIPESFSSEGDMIISDLSGKEVLRQQFTSFENPIKVSVSGIPDGMYMVKLVTPNSVVSKMLGIAK